MYFRNRVPILILKKALMWLYSIWRCTTVFQPIEFVFFRIKQETEKGSHVWKLHQCKKWIVTNYADFKLTKLHMCQKTRSKKTFVFWAAKLCHMWVARSLTVLLCPSALSTQSSIIPSINHDTDGHSGVSVRTVALPLLQPHHYLPSHPHSSSSFKSQEPHKRHKHVHPSWSSHLHQMNNSYNHDQVGKNMILRYFFIICKC